MGDGVREACSFAVIAALVLSLAACGGPANKYPALTGCTPFIAAENYIKQHLPEFNTTESPPAMLEKGNAWEVYYAAPEGALGNEPHVVIDKKSCMVLEAFILQ